MKYLDYPEQQKHGMLDFPYYFYHVTPNHPRYTMPYHWHPLFEIVHVFQGSFSIQLDGCPFLLQQGDSVFIQGGITHGGAPSSEGECIYECALIDLEAVFSHSIRQYEQSIQDLLSSNIQIRPHFSASEDNVRDCEYSIGKINHIILRIFDLLREKPSNYSLMLYGYTCQLFGIILGGYYYSVNRDPQKSKRYDNLKPVFSFIEKHYGEKITLDSLAECANLNPSYFCRYFKDFTHRTPMDYLNYYRIEVACEQLAYTNKSITQIAYDCGFSDSSYFIKVFRHYKHKAPSQY